MIFHQFWWHFQWVNCHQFWWFFYRNVVDSLKFSPFLVIYFSPIFVTFSMSKLSPILVIFVDSSEFNGKWHQFLCEKMSPIDNFLWKFRNLSKLSPFSVKYHILRVLFLLILVLTADWAPCRDGCEEDTEEEQQEGDQEDQGELLLQVGQPAGLAAIFNFIQPVGRDSSLSCKTRMRLFPRAGWKSDSSGQH